MGSGKTTFGKKVAAKLKFQFTDLDEVVCRNTNTSSIKDLVEEKGFDLFREIENKSLKTLSIHQMVISTGGGTPCFYDNLAWMKANGRVVFLDVSEDIIFSRLKTTNMDERPLLKGLDEEGLRKFIHDKRGERLPFYREADIIFDPVNNKMDVLLDLLQEENRLKT